MSENTEYASLGRSKGSATTANLRSSACSSKYATPRDHDKGAKPMPSLSCSSIEVNNNNNEASEFSEGARNLIGSRDTFSSPLFLKNALSSPDKVLESAGKWAAQGSTAETKGVS